MFLVVIPAKAGIQKYAWIWTPVPKVRRTPSEDPFRGIRGSDVRAIFKSLVACLQMLMNSIIDGLKRYFHLPRERAILLCGVLSLAALAAERVLSPVDRKPRRIEFAAARLMERAIDIVREEYTRRGFQFDAGVDPNHTALVGPEYTDITTTLGSVEAKRTTTNPNMARVVVQLLQEAGVKPRDTIAVGCSASFPALLIATLAAAQAMDIHPVIILSLGSSSYGATRSDFNLLDVYEALLRKGWVAMPPEASSLGGARDIGGDYEPDVRDRLIARIREMGIRFLYEPDLRRNVAQRMALYLGPALNRRIAAFINIGGSYAELGTSPLVLKLEPGLNMHAVLPTAKETQGVVFHMMEHHIPVVHLLHIRSLTIKYGLPWDPIPLPKAGAAGSAHRGFEPSTSTWIIAAVYISLMMSIFVLHRKAFFRRLF